MLHSPWYFSSTHSLCSLQHLRDMTSCSRSTVATQGTIHHEQGTRMIKRLVLCGSPLPRVWSPVFQVNGDYTGDHTSWITGTRMIERLVLCGSPLPRVWSPVFQVNGDYTGDHTSWITGTRMIERLALCGSPLPRVWSLVFQVSGELYRRPLLMKRGNRLSLGSVFMWNWKKRLKQESMVTKSDQNFPIFPVRTNSENGVLLTRSKKYIDYTCVPGSV